MSWNAATKVVKNPILSTYSEHKSDLKGFFCQMKQTKPKREDPGLAQFVAQRLKQLRSERNFSQEYVIEHTGLMVAHFEACIASPTLVSLAILCRFYGISLREFFENTEYPLEK